MARFDPYRFRQLMGLIDSANQGEADTSLRAAVEMCKANGLSRLLEGMKLAFGNEDQAEMKIAELQNAVADLQNAVAEKQLMIDALENENANLRSGAGEGSTGWGWPANIIANTTLGSLWASWRVQLCIFGIVGWWRIGRFEQPFLSLVLDAAGVFFAFQWSRAAYRDLGLGEVLIKWAVLALPLLIAFGAFGEVSNAYFSESIALLVVAVLVSISNFSARLLQRLLDDESADGMMAKLRNWFL